MKYVCTLLSVKNMKKSIQFYDSVLGLKVVDDFGANVTLTGNICLQTDESWQTFIHKNAADIIYRNNAAELYFEADDIDTFSESIEERADIELVHPLVEHSWGQRAIRFYDPDYHIIEVGEDLRAVVKRFLSSGLSVSETAVRMDVSEEYIMALM